MIQQEKSFISEGSEMSILAEEVVEVLRDPGSVKVLVTTDESGWPHSVFKHFLTVLDGETIGYVELLENSETYKNMLRNYWAKKKVSVAVYNREKGVSYQIKGVPIRYVMEGPIWDKFLDEVWSVMPDVDPAGVWLIKAEEVVNESYEARKKEIEGRFTPDNFSFWRRYCVRKK